ncbi:MAG: proton-conducting transporter membrane subunit [Gammaproteobacteria bacterium]|nr:proton-conducting transporter membrane subunit [Gammaproteobacteria bacterium]
MVEGLLAPINLIIAALGVGFLLPLIARSSASIARGLFWLTQVFLLLISSVWLLRLIDGAPAVEVITAGIQPPFAINLYFGLFEAFVVSAVNLSAILGSWYLIDYFKSRAASMSVYLILTMGISGMVMTRDLFNLFIFIEITALATYGLLALDKRPASLAAGFKYIIATSLASTFFLLGTMLLYHLTGTLNIDDMLLHMDRITGPVGLAAGVLLLVGVIIELKPYPANGWGLDVYETVPAGVAAMISVGVSAGAFFALYKIVPLLGDFLPVVAAVGGATFLASNFIGLRQRNVRRMLGYSSVAQMGLMTLALAVLYMLGKSEYVTLVIGGLFINHLLAKAGLFWLAGVVDRPRTEAWVGLRHRPILLVILGILLAALAGFPPFPGFWGKWELIMQLSAGELPFWVFVVLLGSLLEAAYLYRWFGFALQDDETRAPAVEPVKLIPVGLFALSLLATGHLVADWLGLEAPRVLVPIYMGIILYALDGMPGRLKALLVLGAFAVYAYPVVMGLEGLHWLFGLILLLGGGVIAFAVLHRSDARRGFYPLLGMLLFSLASLLEASSTLEFFFAWEVLTLSSYLLISMGRGAREHILTFLMFSLGSAFLILAGFGFAYGETGSILLADLSKVEKSATLVFMLLTLGFLVKAGAAGLHVWLPGAYSEAEDDFSALLSAVVGKAAIFGLLLAAMHLAVNGVGAINQVLYVVSWLGLISALVGALMALFQEDVKKLLAYSSMGQVGYIVTAIAVSSQLGWVAAGYLTVNHLLFKGLLFLAVAGLVYQTGTRLMYQMGGLIKNLPMTYISVLIGIIAISGVPPLTGFGGKWLLLNALFDKGWYWQAGLAFFASAVAFLYLFRLIHTVFLGQRKQAHKDLREASWLLLFPQILLIVAIMAFSIWPKLLIDPIASSFAGIFPEALIWDGTMLKTRLGYWDGFMVINIVAGVFLVPLLILLFLSRFMQIQKVKQFNIVFAAERPETPETTHYAYNFFSFYEKALGPLLKPRATAFWDGVSEWSHTIGSTLRVLYTGNGQTYALYVLFYVVMIYIAVGGMG